MYMKKVLLLTKAILLCIGLSAQSPNFVLILTDDQSWNGTSILIKPSEPNSQSDFYETPNLEMLAARGMTFSQAYAPAPKCSPSRNSILTGQSPARAQYTDVSASGITTEKLLDGSNVGAINPVDTTIGE